MKMKFEKFVIYLLVGIFVDSTVVLCHESPLEIALRRDFRNFFETREMGSTLENVAKEIDFRKVLFNVLEEETWNAPKMNLFCTTCAAGVDEILKLNDTNLMITSSIDLCVELNIGSQHVCEEIINLKSDDVIYILSNTHEETGNDICGVVFVSKGCTTKNPDRVWEVPLPDVPKPPIDTTPYPETDVPTLKVLHLADTHYDPEYAPGTPTVCEDVELCCRDMGVSPNYPNETAGFWGSYGACDVPKWTLAAMYEHISQTHKDIDFIIWTGDIIPHNVYETTNEGNVAILTEMADLVSQYFHGIPVFPTLGNHEGNPANQFPQPYVTDPEFDISWLYDELATIWGRWLPEEAVKSVAYSGYYTVLIKPRLKILSMNTNYCNGLNWWLVLDSSDIADNLYLLAKELQASEDIGEMVYIIGHIPPGNSDCSLTWSNQFNKIIARYENTISGLFYGHTHHDHFALFFDPEDKDRAYETVYIGQSQTTFIDLNSGYKIYTVEGDFEGSRYRVLDHENWILDIPMANALNETNFTKLYSAKEEYGLADLSAQSWYDLVLLMNEPDNSMFDIFYRNYVKASNPLVMEGCTGNCKSETLCSLLIADNSDHSKCDIISSN